VEMGGIEREEGRRNGSFFVAENSDQRER
jgi:hypothetical protein